MPNLVAILEDDAASADALSFLIADCGGVAIHGVTPEDLLRRLGPKAAELSHIVSDFHLGDGPDGVSAARALKVAAPDARVLILTGTFRRRGEEMAVEAGFEIMFKPARPAELTAWLTADID